MELLISTDRLISSSEARKRFGCLLKEVASSQEHYFVILDNGKVSALLVNPEWMAIQSDKKFPNIKVLRQSWKSSKEPLQKAFKNLDKISVDQLPKLLQS